MDYIKDIEERLIKYKNSDETLKNLNNRLNKLSMRGCPKDVSAVDFTKIGHGSYSAEAINDLIEVEHLIKQINKIEIDREIISDTLKILENNNSEDYNFVKYKYFENLSMEQVAKELGYSANSNHTLYAIKDRALKKLAYLYWGE